MQAEGHHDSIVNLQQSTTISTLVLKENAPPLYLDTKVLKDKACTENAINILTDNPFGAKRLSPIVAVAPPHDSSSIKQSTDDAQFFL
ncbi:hypothetical protein SORBI_3005G036450 [Sorghum bicolor]|jgi:hypothetical protein|uniref:Uncharacterized protein n=1 Tax=Sorghum bicolor TaxID=4558 RepID=A0A1Z5RGI1_SORBI|nr:hypothetical protein SORBI_3005G036450 [Sorghum bicolor]